MSLYPTRVRDPVKLGLCPLRELVRQNCPGPTERTGPCMSVADFDLVMRLRADRFDWLGRLRLIEATVAGQLQPAKAISYGLTDYALRSSPLAPVYDGVWLVNGYRDVARPADLRDPATVGAWVAATFDDGATVNGTRLTLAELVQWCNGRIAIDPLPLEQEHRNIERHLHRVA